MKRLLIVGAGGMTGTALTRHALAADWDVTALTRDNLDIGDAVQVAESTRRARPDVVINAAGYTAVDAAENARDAAMRVNRDGAANLAQSAAEAGAAIVHISSDYVFDGESATPYAPDAEPHPVSAYGESKLAGEQAVRMHNQRHTIVRTSWVYSHTGDNFLRTMLRLAADGKEIRVVDDQHGSPTCASDLAVALLRVASLVANNADVGGTYHFTNSGSTTWCGFARAIFEERRNSAIIVRPIATREYPTAARRPRYSVLDTSAFTSAFGRQPRPWRDALRSTLELL
ncbi:MAG: dTDP-4-dehydrorhamnose reductase [Gemmatimonadaceae bacterium]